MPRKYPWFAGGQLHEPRRFNEAGADAPEIPAEEIYVRVVNGGFNEAGADAPEIPTSMPVLPPEPSSGLQ